MLDRWFTDFKHIVKEYEIDLKNIYNMDEIGLLIIMQVSFLLTLT